MQNDEMQQINRPEFIEPIPMSPKSPKSPSTPIKSRAQSPVCPGAPVRPHRQLTLDEADIVRPLPIHIPSVEEHKGKGILPDYFIKPEPGMPLWEKRKYILSELEQWFTSPTFIQHVKDAAILDEAGQLGDVTNWPAGIVYSYHKILALDNHIAETCVEVYERCVAYLRDGGLLNSHLTRILDQCTLNNGSTIEYLWDKSDLDGLRDAPPLPENDSSDDDDEEEEEEEENETPFDGFSFDLGVKGEAIDLDLQVKIPLKVVLLYLFLSALWLMLNTYVLCKGGKC